MAPNSRISMCVTSCNRHDLLRKTLESFFASTDIEPQEVLICEDSDTPMPEWLNDPIWRSRNLTWISNGCRMGQIYSCDRLMSEVKYEYVFWCEDDWNFVDTNFMRESKDILDKYREIIMVSLRGDTGWHPLVKQPNYPFKIAEPYWRGGWGGFAFNPGLRRTSDYKALGSYGKHVSYGTSGLGHELQLSKKLLDQGYRIADLGRVIVEHTGNGRSRASEPLNSLPKILIAVPACFKFDYTKWESEESPSYDPKKAWNGKPYGTDIHISGENPRIQAVRETWFKDVEPFKSHVDAKFFYGAPATGYPRQALTDEVFLSCPDDYEHLPQKTIAICKWAVEHDYDWLFKCDDDSYVWVDRLVREVLENRFDYAGYLNGGVCSGGPGYWLSKRAMKIVSTFNPWHWAEDVSVGHAMNNFNIHPVHLEGHRPGFSAHWFDLANVPENAVCIHAVKPEGMHELNARKK